MIIAAMQPYLFPYIGYFQLMEAADKLILHDGLAYVRRGFMHRNWYLEPGVGPKAFQANVLAATRSGRISEVRLADHTGWRRLLSLQLKNAYARSSYFNDVYPLVEKILLAPTDRLAQLSAAGIQMVRDYLRLECQLELTAQAYTDMEVDLASEDQDWSKRLEPPLDRRNLRILMLCQRNQAEIFINPIGGTGLYDGKLLKSHGVEIRFLQSDLPAYRQLHSNDFVPNLSILDMLFNCSVDQCKDLLTQYRLVSGVKALPG